MVHEYAYFYEYIWKRVYSIDPIMVSVRTLNTSSEGRCWGVKKVLGVNGVTSSLTVYTPDM